MDCARVSFTCFSSAWQQRRATFGDCRRGSDKRQAHPANSSRSAAKAAGAETGRGAGRSMRFRWHSQARLSRMTGAALLVNRSADAGQVHLDQTEGSELVPLGSHQTGILMLRPTWTHTCTSIYAHSLHTLHTPLCTFLCLPLSLHCMHTAAACIYAS